MKAYRRTSRTHVFPPFLPLFPAFTIIGESYPLADVHMPSISLTFMVTEMSPDTYRNSEPLGRRTIAEVIENSSLVTSLERLNLKVDESLEFVNTGA